MKEEPYPQKNNPTAAQYPAAVFLGVQQPFDMEVRFLMDLRDLVSFLIEAKRRTYAAQGDDASVAPVLNGSKQLEFRSGDFLYRDIYFGFRFFVGQEVVEFRGRPVWSMVYSGGMTDAAATVERAREVYTVLRQALRLVGPSHLYRGPSVMEAGEFTYRNTAAGGVENFSGYEEIRYLDSVVYALNYCGGLIR